MNTQYKKGVLELCVLRAFVCRLQPVSRRHPVLARMGLVWKLNSLNKHSRRREAPAFCCND